MAHARNPLEKLLPAPFAHGTALVALVALLAVPDLRAQSTQYAAGAFTWDNGTTAKWASSTGGPYTSVWTSGNDAVFEGSAGVAFIAAAGVTAHNLTFNTTGYSILNNTLTLSGTAPTISTGTGVTATVASVIAGSAGLTKAEGGTLTLAAANTYSGATTINAGTLALAVSSVAPPAGAVLHLDASTLSLANGAAVTALANLGTAGSSLDAAPTVTGQYPTFNAAALNGRGTIHMTGQQGLQTANNLGITGNADRSIFVVMARGNGTNNATGSMYLQTGTVGGNNPFGIGDCFNTLYLPYTYSANDQTTTTRPALTYDLLEALHTSAGNANYGYVNGTVVGPKSVTTTTTDGRVQIGYRSGDNTQVTGDFAEVLIYNSYLNDAQRQQVEAYLRAKWLTGSLPPGRLPAATALSIAAGATFDVSYVSAYTLGSDSSLTASGTGTTPGTDAAVIMGNSSGTVSLGTRPVTLNFTPASVAGDTTHPALVVSQGALTLGGAITVNIGGSTPLGAGSYRLISQTSGSISGIPTLAATTGPGGNGLATNMSATLLVTGGQVNLVVSSTFTTPTVTLARHDGTGDSTTYGDSLSFDVAVTPTSPSPPTGWVTLKDGGADGTILGSYQVGALDNGVCTITPALNALKAGSHANIVVVYAGDANFLSGTSAALSTQTVAQKELTIAGAAAPKKIVDGTTATTLSGTLSGVVGGDTVALTLAAHFASATVGTQSVISDSTIDTASQDNYILTQPTGLTADIVAAGIWTGATDSHWNQTTTGNWLGDLIAGDWQNVTFDANTVNGTVALDWYKGTGTISLNSGLTTDVTITNGTQNALIQNGSPAEGINIAADSQNLTLNMSQYTLWGSETWSIGTGRSLTVNGAISGTGGITKDGSGTAVLTGTNSYSGATTVSAGTLTLAGPPAAPTSPPDGAVLHLDASTLGLADGAAVTALANLGSGGSGLDTAPISGPPTFNAPGSAGALNGLGTIHMTGQQGLITASNLGITGNSDRSIFVVMRRASGANMNLTTGVLGYDVAYGISDQNTGVLYLPYTYGPSDLTFTAPPAGTYRIYEVTRSGNISYGYLNGVLQGSKNVAINTSDAKVQIGYRTDGQQVSGDFAEVLIYNSYLDDAQRQQVVAYLQAKWLPGSLPSATALSISAGATLDVSAITRYTLGAGTSLTAGGTGTALGTDAAAITGAAGGTVDLGARPISLTWNGNSSGTDSAHPPLVVSQGTLSLNGNTFTVVVPGTALNNGVYTLVATPSEVSGTVNPTPYFTGGNGLVEGATGVISISGNNVILTVTGTTTGAYASWAVTHDLTGTAGDGSNVDPAFTADPNKDGVANGLVWLIGGATGDPLANSRSILPVPTDDGGKLVLNFQCLKSSARGTANLYVEYSKDLGLDDAWHSVAVPDADQADGGSGVGFLVAPIEGSDYNNVTATIAASVSDGKLFGRLRASE